MVCSLLLVALIPIRLCSRSLPAVSLSIRSLLASLPLPLMLTMAISHLRPWLPVLSRQRAKAGVSVLTTHYCLKTNLSLLFRRRCDDLAGKHFASITLRALNLRLFYSILMLDLPGSRLCAPIHGLSHHKLSASYGVQNGNEMTIHEIKHL